jgi:3-oxoadipate enol-lactonase
MPTVHVGDIDLFYQDDDFADPWAAHDTVFLQHGLGRNSNFWRAWVPWLARDYRVLRMDLRGFDRSGDPGPDYRYSAQGLLDDFVGFLDACEIERVHYIGESAGGIIGAAAAARYPERFRSLTLVSTPVRVKPEATGKVLALDFPSWQDAMLSLGMKEWWLRTRAALGELTGDPARDEYYADECARTPVHIVVAFSLFAPTVSLATILPEIAAPTLMLTPGSSAHTSREEQDSIARSIPNVRQRVYEGAKHGMFYLMPDLLAQDTLAFLRSLRG